VLAQKNRIHGRRTFVVTLKKGRVVRGQYFNINYSDNNAGRLKAAVVVSKKISKSAVVRNRLRRRLYEILRKNFLTKLGNKNLIIIVFNPDIVNLKSAELENLISNLISKIKDNDFSS
jgi:ribonuclease P protein component